MSVAVYKSKTVEFIDAFYADSTNLAGTLQYARGLLASNAGALSATTLALQQNNGLAAGTANDFDQYWLDPNSPLGGQPIERVLRLGYQEAINLALSSDPPRPIETLWVTGATDEFQVHICEGTRAVTVLMLIPLARTYGSQRATSRSWVVRLGGLRESVGQALDDGVPPVVKVQTSGPA
jgi:hypothetical protein